MVSKLPPVAILMGGLATRMRPVTETIPKALVEVGGEPFVNHQLRQLRAQGVDEVVFCVGYRGEMIEELIGDGAAFGLRVRYSYDGEKLLGTGGAIVKALPSLVDVFFVLYGDSYLDVSYSRVHEAFLRSGKRGLMVVFHNENRWDQSNVRFEHGAIQAYSKRLRDPGMGHIDYGLGLLRAEVFRRFGPTEVVDLASIYEELAARGELAGYEALQRFYEVGSFQGLEELDQLLRERRGSHGICQ